ncbi:MAG: RDD family protein [Myxococcota bacterium]
MTNARRLALQTPEEVPLVFELAPLGSRVLAFTLDLLVVIMTIVAITVLVKLAIGDAQGDDGSLLMEAVHDLAAFFVWNFYFVFTELRWHGRTIGKRVAGIRVIARDGGPLTADLVFARNLTRNIEWLLPLLAIVDSRVLGIDSPALLVVCWLWLGVMAFLPLLNRYHSRVGDLIAGTLVVSAPVERLLPDLVAESASPALADGPGWDAGEYKFTPEQLDTYGIHELQILEDVLRRYPSQIDPELLGTIADKIRYKIRWEADLGQRVDPYPFLRAFYAAQRARLEHQMLFGQRREHKVR